MKISISKRSLYPVIVVLTILLSKTQYFGVVNRSIYQYVLYIASIMGIVLFGVKRKKISQGLLCIIPFLGLIALNTIVNYGELWSDGINTALGVVFSIICSMLIAVVIPRNVYATWYIRIMAFFAIVSLVCCTIANIDPNLARHFCQPGYDWQTPVGYSMLYTWGWNGTIFSRNSGPFWEPGAYQGFLLLALLMLIYDVDEGLIVKRKSYLLLLLITILTTQSTVAYILLICLVFTHWQKIEKVFPNVGKGLRFLLVAALSIGVIAIIISSNNIVNKFTGIDSNSASIRLSDIAGGFLMILKGGFLGLGNTTSLDAARQILGVNSNDSAGLLSMIYTYGMLFGIGYLGQMIIGIKRFFSISKIGEWMIVVGIFVILHMTEGIWQLPVFLVVMISGMMNKGTPQSDYTIDIID